MTVPTEKSWRRWFQFRISTWLVLVGILCWAMALWPFYDHMDAIVAMINDTIQDGTGITGPYDPGRPGSREPFSGYWGFDRYLWFWKVKLSIEKLVQPIFALAAFIGWKAAWLFIERRRQRFTALQ